MAKTDKNIDNLWLEYKSTEKLVDKHKIFTNYIWLVKYVIQQMNIPKINLLEEEDYINIGIIGLNDAIERFEPERGIKFESYAMPRIRGTIQDELRRLDWLSRTARKKANDYLDATDSLRMEYGREVSSEEVMNKLGLTKDQYMGYLQAAAAAKASLSMNETTKINMGGSEDDELNLLEEIPDKDEPDILSKMENEERVGYIATYLNNLTEKKRLVMTLYYYEELTFKEIGKVLNISESRVCQIHTQVVGNLKDSLLEYDNA